MKNNRQAKAKTVGYIVLIALINENDWQGAKRGNRTDPLLFGSGRVTMFSTRKEAAKLIDESASAWPWSRHKIVRVTT